MKKLLKISCPEYQTLSAPMTRELDVGMIITCGFIFLEEIDFSYSKFTTAEKNGLRSVSTKINELAQVPKYQFSQHC